MCHASIGISQTENLATIKAFYGAPERALSGIETELIDSEAEVLECVTLREREIGSVRRYLSAGG
jgi:hypothetical protein